MIDIKGRVLLLVRQALVLVVGLPLTIASVWPYYFRWGCDSIHPLLGLQVIIGYFGTVFFTGILSLQPAFVKGSLPFYIMYASGMLLVVVNPNTLLPVKNYASFCAYSCFASAPDCPPPVKPIPESIF